MHSRLASSWMTMLGLFATSMVVGAPVPESTTPADPRPKLSRDRVAYLDGSMERILQEFAIPGLAIGIVDNGQPVYMRGFGLRDSQTDQPVNAHTMFHLASLTRSFTATAIMQLAERRQLGLTDSIADSPLTVMQLLTSDDDAFDALASIIESASHQKYLDYMQASVLDAAGLRESTFALPPADANVAWPHVGQVFVRRAQNYPWKPGALAGTGLNASITDVTRWAALQVTRDPSLLSPASYDAMMKRHRDGEGEGSASALGWQLERRGDEWLPRQTLRARGFSGLLTLYPAQQRAIVILSNGETTPDERIRAVIESVLAGGSYVSPTPPLFLRSEFKWALGALVGLSLMLIGVSLRYRSRRHPAR
jgi:CubicO group peptidase (beta-lactamase class C family)